MAKLKTINKSNNVVELSSPAILVYENFEIKTLDNKLRNDLIESYDYHIPFYYWGQPFARLKKNEYIEDTISIEHNIKIKKVEPNYYLIRVIDVYYLGNDYISNWDTIKIIN